MLKNNIIRIRLKSFDFKLINISYDEIINTTIKSGAKVRGPVFLPTKIKKFIVTTSPHVDKDAREQYELRIYKCLMDILKYTDKTIDLLTRLNLSSGVDVKIRLISK